MTHRGSHACRYRRCNMFDYTDTRETLKSTAWMSVLLSINIKYNHIQIVSSFIIAIFLSIASIPFIFVCPPRQRGTHGDKILANWYCIAGHATVSLYRYRDISPLYIFPVTRTMNKDWVKTDWVLCNINHIRS